VAHEYAARRLKLSADELLPNVIAYRALGATLAGYKQWLRDEDADLATLLEESLGQLAIGFVTAQATESPDESGSPGPERFVQVRDEVSVFALDPPIEGGPTHRQRTEPDRPGQQIVTL
jgi:hypothetical protein